MISIFPGFGTGPDVLCGKKIPRYLKRATSNGRGVGVFATFIAKFSGSICTVWLPRVIRCGRGHTVAGVVAVGIGGSVAVYIVPPAAMAAMAPSSSDFSGVTPRCDSRP